MKILQLGKYYPPDFGGIETVTKILAEGLNEAGVPCDVLCTNSTRLTRVDQIAGYRVIRIRSYGKVFSVPICPELISWLWRLRNEYDIIHIHLPNPLAELAVFLVRPTCKLIIHWHGDVDGKKFRLLAKIYAPLTNWLLRRANKVVGATRAHIYDSYAKNLMMGKEAVIPYPFQRPRITDIESLRKKFGYKSQGQFVILAVGRLIYYKGFQYLIEAAKLLPDDCLILIAGSGPLEAQLTAQIETGCLENKVKLCGRLDDLSLLAHFEACDLFCFPSVSRGEMFGMVQLEAMFFGKPVVNTLIPKSGVQEVSQNGKTGFSVPIMDAKAIADAVLKLKCDISLRKSMGDAALIQINEVFDKTVVIPKFINLFRECFDG